MSKFKGNFFIRNMDPALHKALKAKANEEDKSITELVIEILRKALDGKPKEESK